MALFKRETEGLEVVQASFQGQTKKTWEDLFSGFDRLYAITYSSSVGFVTQVAGLFHEVEIVFGYEKVLRDFESILAYQQAALEELKAHFGEKHQALLERIDDGTLRLHLLRDRVSHKKVFLLESDDGRTRVIVGSANLSAAAFGGHQAETIVIFEDRDAFEYFMVDFNVLKKDCTDFVIRQAIVSADENEIGNIPILHHAGELKVPTVVVLRTDRVEERSESVILRTNALSKKYAEIAPQPDKKGKITLVPMKVREITKRFVNRTIRDDADTPEPLPELIVDLQAGQVTLRGKPLGLSFEADDVRRDLTELVAYMDGFQQFRGNVRGLVANYFAFANWFFASPFVSLFRDKAHEKNKSVYLYPAFAVLYGKSNAGKSDFIKTLMHMMFGFEKWLPAKDFTTGKGRGMQMELKQFPLVVDDITRDRFTRNAVELIKNDAFTARHHSVIVFSANKDLDALDSEITKRVVCFRFEAAIEKKRGVQSSNLVRAVRSTVGTSFYHAYLSRMMVRVGEMLDEMELDVDQPDLLRASSEVICGLFGDHLDEQPWWAKELSWGDYVDMGDEGVKAEILKLFQTNPDFFIVDTKRNDLRITIEKDVHKINSWKKKIPDHIINQSAGSTIVLFLDQAQEFFGIPFKKGGYFSKLLGK